MKHHKRGSITIIEGGSIHTAAMGEESVPQTGAVGPVGSTEHTETLGWWRSPDGNAPIRGVALDPVPPEAAGLSFWPVAGLSDFDSLVLGGSPGVLRVGVNELGWVVYDWIPGP